MKSRFLVRENPELEESPLISVSCSEWREIVRQNPTRYFIKDEIYDGKPDRIYIEVSREYYLEHRKETNKKIYLKRTAPHYGSLSLDARILDGTVVSLHEVVSSGYCLEEEAISAAMMEFIRKQLVDWKPWAGDMLDIYFELEPKYGFEYFSSIHHVKKRTYYKYRTQFEEKIKKILK